MSDVLIALELDPPQYLPWMDEASCAQVDPEFWFPEKGGSTRDAKRVCSECPVMQECLDYALEHDVRFGIWGGLSEIQRRRLRPRSTRSEITRQSWEKRRVAV